MRKQTRRRALLLAFAFALMAAAGGDAAAQDAESARQSSRADTNHEVLLHLLVTAEGAEAAARTPQSLEGVVRHLKASLPPADYRLAATFINRVRDGGFFEVKTAGASPFGSSQTPSQHTPAFFQISFTGVKLLDAAQPSVNIQQFRLGMKVPIQTGTVSADKSAAGGYPVVQYEDTGISTQLNVREGEPTLVGTLNTSRPGQLYVVVVTVRRIR